MPRSGLLSTALVASETVAGARVADVTLAPAVPEELAGYRLLRVLGRGGMGTVYEAEDTAFGRRVALKIIAAEHVSSPEAVERFRREGRLASTIAHPRCVFVYAADEAEGRPYIVMELMSGVTLQTLVDERGPLAIEDAIAKISDVIEGLREAHHQGVIHRDVKPSNCFVEANGRVKVGDFGLSKSLEVDPHLTRTGAFIGTPLYASPEQIKRAPIDARTDVYSVAATLYDLLAGRPPFHADDAAAVLARIVSEDPTPLRSLRPEVPHALEAAILRGLERDRARRWQTLGDLHAALLPFQSSRLSLGGIGLRLAAFVLDASLFQAIDWSIFGLMVLFAVNLQLGTARVLQEGPIIFGLTRLVWLLYFIVLEGRWGVTLGKRLLGLRVSAVAGGGPPGLKRAAVRTGLFYLLTGLPGDLAGLLSARTPGMLHAVIAGSSTLAIHAVGDLLLLTTMRARNGYRGPHEWVSGTRVIRLPRHDRRRAPKGRRPPPRSERFSAAVARPTGVLRDLGPFRVQGAVRWEPGRKVLLAEDSTLERPVWVVLRPRGAAPPSPSRRDPGRPTRARWLNGGEQTEGRWDAFVAPTGCPLTDLAGPFGLPWRDVLPILRELAEELAAACAEGSLPEELSVDQVWVQPDGSVQLVDTLEPAPEGRPAATDPDRSFALLGRVAKLALEGGRGPSQDQAAATVIRAPVPEHAARVLEAVFNPGRRFSDVASFVAALDADRDRPTEVERARRGLHLGVQALPVGLILLAMHVLAYPGRTLVTPPFHVPTWQWIVSGPLVCIVWACLTRGGIGLRLAGIALVRADNRRPGLLRCAWRALMFWAAPTALLLTSWWLRDYQPGLVALRWGLWGASLATVPTFVGLALLDPVRALHDKLSGTFLVPK